MKEEKKKYKFLGMILEDGDTFEVQMEKPGENPYNPTGIAIVTFNHKNYNGVEEIKPNHNPTL